MCIRSQSWKVIRSKWKRMTFYTESGMLPKECGKKNPIECENKTTFTSPAIRWNERKKRKHFWNMLVLVLKLSKPIDSCSVIHWYEKLQKNQFTDANTKQEWHTIIELNYTSIEPLIPHWKIPHRKSIRWTNDFSSTPLPL